LRRFRLNLPGLLLLLLLQGAGINTYASDFDATLYWAEIQVVNFPLDGGIKQVHVRPGEKVNKGAKLVDLDAEPIAIRIRQHEAEVAAARPVMADAGRAYEQAQSLYEQTVLSDDELQRARHAYEKASAELAAATARLDYARWQHKRARVLAPWDAWVVRRNAEPGQMLVAEQRSKPLLVLAKSAVMGASAEVPLAALDTVSVGQAASVKIGDKTFSARVSSFVLQADAQKGGARYRLDAVFSVPTDDVFRAGQAATISLP